MRQVSRPTIEVIQQPWGMETVLARTATYTLKQLFYWKGHAGGFQYHMTKWESFHLAQGDARVEWVGADGIVTGMEVSRGATFTVPPGAPHKFIALTDCIVYEASDPIMGDRVNVSERYGYYEEPGGLPTTWSAEQIAAFEVSIEAENQPAPPPVISP